MNRQTVAGNMAGGRNDWMQESKRVCAECGIAFVPNTATTAYCSDECRRKVHNRQMREYRERNRDAIAELNRKRSAEKRAEMAYLRHWKSTKRLDEKVALARAAGMSYGKFMGMMRLMEGTK